MMSFRNPLLRALLLVNLASAAPPIPRELLPPVTREIQPRGPTCNTAANRQCWTSTTNINTDYETTWPTTGTTTRSYTFTVTEVNNWVGGDGVAKVKAMLINGQYPGPTITADWGDTVSVTVINNLVTNGTSIHWHGIRQLNSNIQDGSSGISECPIPPGSSKTYTFLATQYGTSWYHSHFSSQYGNGVLGSIVINGPASANYDVDLGPLMVSDWYYGGVDAIQHRVSDPSNPFIPGFPGAPPPSDNILFNGKNRNPLGAGGSYQKFVLTAGQKHLVRLINPSVENTFTLSLVGHSFQIVATDLVPITPVTVSSIYIGVGQRYDVIINANQAVSNYWFNATLSSAPCGQSKNNKAAMIFQYSGAANTNPTTAGSLPTDSKCADVLTYVPIVSKSAPVAAWTPSASDTLNAKLSINNFNGVNRVFWPVNNSPMNVSWSKPTLQYVKDGTTGTMPATENVISVPTANTWTFWLIQNNSSFPHPVHLHGHDVLILGASPALANPIGPGNSLRSFNPATDKAGLVSTNPTRRDSTMLPAWGWLVVAFYSNNPGAWLFHCHVAWHVAQGFSVQFLEQLSNIPGAMSLTGVTTACNTWKAYYPSGDPYWQEDSGI